MKTFPDVIIEDPAVTDDILPLLEEQKHRLSWDYPITGIGSIQKLPYPPNWLNIKPSRFGTIKNLLDTIEYCRNHNIRMYGGGQFELGVGRRHIQSLASVFYPDTPNDVAPGGYNKDVPPEDLPKSPLRIQGHTPGLSV
jgi:hypothetical protein